MQSFIRQACRVLEKHGELKRIKEPVSPDLVMAEMAREAFAQKALALFFENVIGSPFPAVCNLFGTEERAELLLGGKLAFGFSNISRALHALPLPAFRKPVMQREISLSQIPQLRCYPRDGGAFITLPLVATQKPGTKHWMHTNLGMYRVQISGNDYEPGAECGLHYQIQRGIGIHHQEALARGETLKVSVFVGGHPGHILAAIMPLPSALPELPFAGMFAKRTFRYTHYNGWLVSAEADFCILGEIQSGLKPEGPFGDHLGYYSEQHPFPYFKVHKVFARKDAVFPFTVVGRPPQEDTIFGNLIHKLTAPLVPFMVPGVKEVNAVDAAGVHPLLLAKGSERFAPYQPREPLEILTQASALLGFGQLSLAKYLFISAKEDNNELSVRSIPEFIEHILCRINLGRDIHFHTSVSIDTLDYSGTSLNHGSKVVFAAAGEPVRELGSRGDDIGELNLPQGFKNAKQTHIKGVLAVECIPWQNQETAVRERVELCSSLAAWKDREKYPLVVLCDNADFVSETLNNCLWVTFTRSDPATDISGVNERFENKHWACCAPLVIDARKKTHHAQELLYSKYGLCSQYSDMRGNARQ